VDRPVLWLNCNFWLFVAKRGKASFRRITDTHNMVTGKELATGRVDRATPLVPDSKSMQVEGHKVGSPVRIIAKLCGVMKSKVPVGYEDEGGFHFGADLAG
jgi:hypothetical protein